ncbi:unnamed protein product [Rhodiola kirilowii]
MSPYFWMKNMSNQSVDDISSDDSLDHDTDEEQESGDLLDSDANEEQLDDSLDHDASEGQVGDLRKGPWISEEDAKLRKLVRKHGARNWRKLGHALNRCGKSCRLRWHNHLKPDIISVRQVPFTRQEDKVIVSMVRISGKKWSQIAKTLPGRTDNQVKNRYYSAITRRRNLALKYIQKHAVKSTKGAHSLHNQGSSRSSSGSAPIQSKSQYSQMAGTNAKTN